MSEEAAKTPAAGGEKKRRGLSMMVVILLMAGQGEGVFFLTKALSGPPVQAAASPEAEEGEHKSEEADSHGQEKPADAHAKPADDHGSGDAHAKPADGQSADDGHGSKPAGGHGTAESAENASVGCGDGFAEVKLTELKTINRESGRIILVHVRLSALVTANDSEKAKKVVEAKQSRIDDRVNTLLRSAQPRHLAEPNLETLKRALKQECDRIFEDEKLVREVLIPQLLQTGGGL